MSKRFYWGFCLFFSLLIVLFSFNSGYSVENVKALEAGESQKKYERKAILGVGLGISKREIKLAQKINGKCALGRFYAKIDDNLMYNMSRMIYDWLITQRYDKIIITPSSAFIITATKKIEIPDISSLSFPFKVESYAEFKTDVENYLNSLSEIVSKLMSSAMEARYEELPEKEKETFITTKAKELGIPVEVAKKLMSSAFAFAAYVDIGDGMCIPKLNIVKGPYVEITQGKGMLGSIVYTVEVGVPATIRVLVYRFNPDTKKFELYKEFSQDTGTLGIGYSKTFIRLYPSDRDIQNVFKTAMVEKTSKVLAIAAQTELKKDDAFAIFATVDKVKGRKVFAKIGVQEDLRVDAPYLIRREVNGKMKIFGFVKARKVALNCLSLGDKRELYSQFDIIKGTAEFKDQLREHPWTGAFLGLEAGVENFKVNSITDVWGTTAKFKDNGLMKLFRFGAYLDLGYATNNELLSEVWLTYYLGLGVGEELESDIPFNLGYVSSNATDTPLYLTTGIEIGKRFYIGTTGVYVTPSGEIGISYLSAPFKDATDESLYIYAFSYGVKAKLGYNFSPDLEAMLSIGYKSFSVLSVGLSSGGSYDSADVSGGINVFVGFKYHIPTVGIFSGLYKKPSTVCEKIMKKSKK